MEPKRYTSNAVHYKVIELSTVTDETIESVLNEWTEKGWVFDQIQFVVRDASRRPSMAFMFFVRPVASGDMPTFEQIEVKTDDEKDEESHQNPEASDESDEGDIVWN